MPVYAHFIAQHLSSRCESCNDWKCLLCRFVILLSDDKDYFFILYLVYVGVNILLAGIALLHWPGTEQLELVNDPEGYQVRLCSCCVSWMCMYKPTFILVRVESSQWCCISETHLVKTGYLRRLIMSLETSGQGSPSSLVSPNLP